MNQELANVLAQLESQGVSAKYNKTKLLSDIETPEKEYALSSTAFPSETIPFNKGDTEVTMDRSLLFPVSDDLSAEVLTKEGQVTESLKQEYIRYKVPVHHFGAWFKMHDVTKKVFLYKVETDGRSKLAKHYKEVREKYLINTVKSQASEYYAGGVATSIDQLDPQNDAHQLKIQELTFLKNVAKMNEVEPFKDGSMLVIIPTPVMDDLVYNDERIKTTWQYGGQNNEVFVKGTLKGTKIGDLIFMDTSYSGYASKNSSGKTVFMSVLLGKDGLRTAKLGSDSVEWVNTDKNDPLDRYQTAGYKAWIGAAIERTEAVTAIYSVSPQYSSVSYNSLRANQNFEEEASETTLSCYNGENLLFSETISDDEWASEFEGQSVLGHPVLPTEIEGVNVVAWHESPELDSPVSVFGPAGYDYTVYAELAE